jgi:hypothetical protein
VGSGRFALVRVGLAACSALPIAAWAGEVTHFEILDAGHNYRLEASALIDAPRDQVWRVLTDYGHLSEVSPRILESEVIRGSPPGVTRVRTLNRLCFLIFCRNLRHVQLIRERGYGDFESVTVPAESDLTYGRARWHLTDEGARTGLSIDFTFALDVHTWLPRFVGRLVVRSVLRADAQALIAGIEAVAHRSKTPPRGH